MWTSMRNFNYPLLKVFVKHWIRFEIKMCLADRHNEALDIEKQECRLKPRSPCVSNLETLEHEREDITG